MSSPSSGTVSIAIAPSAQGASQSRAASTARDDSGFAPTALSDFNCYAINITGSSISPNTLLNCEDGSQPLGIVGGMVSATAGGSLSFSVPTGTQTFQLLGFYSSSGTCPSIQTVLQSPPQTTNGLKGPYLLGQTTTDVESDTSISLTAAFNASTQAIYNNCATGGQPWNASDNNSGVTLGTLSMPTPNPLPLLATVGEALPGSLQVFAADNNGNPLSNVPITLWLSNNMQNCQESSTFIPGPSNNAALSYNSFGNNQPVYTGTNGVATFTDIDFYVSNNGQPVYLVATSENYNGNCYGPINVFTSGQILPLAAIATGDAASTIPTPLVSPNPIAYGPSEAASTVFTSLSTNGLGTQVPEAIFAFSLSGVNVSNFSAIEIQVTAGGTNTYLPPGPSGATVYLWNNSNLSWVTAPGLNNAASSSSPALMDSVVMIAGSDLTPPQASTSGSLAYGFFYGLSTSTAIQTSSNYIFMAVMGNSTSSAENTVTIDGASVVLH